MVLVKDITSSTRRKPIIGSSNGGGIEKNLLDLTPSDVVFYVGGYPSNFTVSGRKTHGETFPLPISSKSTFFLLTPATDASELAQVQGLHRVLLGQR